jgi:CRP-like cAMP-binding protein
MPIDVNGPDMDKLDSLVATRRKIKRGDALFSNGDRFDALYAIRTGFFKTRVTTEDGRDQVTGFQMAGEIIGLDGIVGDRHSCDAVALEDAEVCEMPYGRIEELSREVPALQTHVHKIMSREIVREHGVMLLGSMRAEERLAAFLLNLVQRLHAGLFALGAGAAHDARGDRQLPGPQARDRQPHLLEVCRGRPDRGQAPARAHPRPGGAARPGQRARRALIFKPNQPFARTHQARGAINIIARYFSGCPGSAAA